MRNQAEQEAARAGSANIELPYQPPHPGEVYKLVAQKQHGRAIGAGKNLFMGVHKAPQTLATARRVDELECVPVDAEEIQAIEDEITEIRKVTKNMGVPKHATIRRKVEGL
eukprot:1223525-Karenia_brevis.AAC.1